MTFGQMTRKPLRCFWLLWLWLALCVCVPCRTHAQIPETLSGDTIDALWSRAVASWEQDAVDDTLSGLLEIEALDPEHAALHLALGAAYHRKKELPRALHYYELARRRQPDNVDILTNLGHLHYEMRDLSSSIAYFQRVLELNASRIENMGQALALACHLNGDFHAAESYYRRVEKRTATFYFDFGVTLQSLGKIVEANQQYNRALDLDSDMPHVWLNIAALHHRYGDVEDAIRNYQQALHRAGNDSKLAMLILMNLGVALEISHDVPQALGHFDTALAFADSLDTSEAKQHRLTLHVHMGRARKKACMWEDLEQRFDHLWHLVETNELAVGRPSSLLPFDTLMQVMPQATRRQVAQIHASQYSHLTKQERPPMLDLLPSAADDDDNHGKGTRLHVGYISYDFTDHPTTHLLNGLFSNADHSSMVVSAFGYGRDDGSLARQTLISLVDGFVNLVNESIEHSVAQIQSMGVHILMDAQGFTQGSRPQIVAAKPAPIVVNYLVYPGTSGAQFVDYLVSDRLVTPPELADGYSEKLVLLQGSYQVNHYDLRLSERQKLWQETNPHKGSDDGERLLFMDQDEDDAFVFVNFNKIDKLEPLVFSIWMAVLRRVPNSVLLLLDPATLNAISQTSQAVVRNLRAEAAAQGVHSDRIRFVPRMDKQLHLLRHRLGDLFLDTFVYGAHSTATDALYAGLPVLTLAGDSFASRVGISLLSNLDMEDLVAFSCKEYEDLAVSLALKASSSLDRIRRDLQGDVRLKPLFDTQRYTTQLEAAQRIMFDLYSLGHPPQHIVMP